MSIGSMSRFLARVVSGLAFLVLAACAVNPATGRRELSLVGEGQEIEMGREGKGQVASSLGLVPDSALQAYVSGLGLRLASLSERPELPWSFQVVDDPVVNAFALPGGFIFVTRGILAHFESEAELVGVLGHEIGHVTAKHSVRQMSRQQLQQIGLGVGMILSEDVRNYGGLLSAGLGLLNLSYSRGDETQADELGVRYMSRGGYDAGALVGVFQMLAAVSGGEGDRVPQWQLTHPYPENREAHIREIMASTPVSPGGDQGRDRYLDMIQGLIYGENPREGYFKENRFFHPDMAFQLEFPRGWKGVNQRTAVGGMSPDQNAMVVLALADGAEDPASALRTFLAQEGVQGGSVRQSDEYGLPRARALFSAATPDGELRGEVAFVKHGSNVFRIMGFASAGGWAQVAQAVGASLGSFAPVTDATVLGVRPRRIEIVRVPEAMTMEAFARRFPSSAPIDEISRLNRRDAGARIDAGTRLKRVVGDPIP
jgi:predicted Zn-dependent protease